MCGDYRLIVVVFCILSGSTSFVNNGTKMDILLLNFLYNSCTLVAQMPS